MADQQTQLLQELVESMKANNESTSNIEADGRNTRRHLLEIKKMQGDVLSLNERLTNNMGDFAEGMSADKLAGVEKSREQMAIFQNISDSLKGLPKQIGSENADNDKKSKKGLANIGKFMGGAGLGVGAAAAGIAAVFASSAFLIGKLEDMDSDKIKYNVVNLVGIVDELGGAGNTLKDGGALALAMGGIGIGLAAFAIGAGASNVVDKFQEDGWTDQIKKNVVSLLSINDAVGGNVEFIKESGSFGLAMTGLGAGLAAFSIGAGAASIVDKFSDGGFAEGIKSEVLTLLSIGPEAEAMGTDFLKEGGKFALAMTGLGIGLAAFSIGKGVAGGAEAFTKMSDDNPNFAEGIKAEVTTLLSINDLPGAGAGESGVANFVGTMSGLALGLTAFSAGKGAEGVASFISMGTEGNFAENIKRDVTTLLSIGEGSSAEQVADAAASLGIMGAALAAFGAGKGIDALASLGAGAAAFLFGDTSPVSLSIKAGENAGTIKEGADAMNTFADAYANLAELSDTEVDFNLKDLIKDIKKLNEAFTVSVKMDGADLQQLSVDIAAAIQTAQLTAANQQPVVINQVDAKSIDQSSTVTVVSKGRSNSTGAHSTEQ
tara:strand:- start:4227 stop:6038 length:1812 start_codon:yes stop_codon:yes gene_type:complete